MCAIVTPVALHALKPQARRVGLQIPSELRVNQSLELGSLNPKCCTSGVYMLQL